MNQVTKPAVFFDCYGTHLGVYGHDFSAALQTLSSFRHFETENEINPTIKIYLETKKKAPVSGVPVFRFRKSKAYGWSNRIIIYPEHQSVYLTKSNDLTEAYIYSEDPEFLNELLFLTISSLLGWQLESKGWIRLHAMSFLKNDAAVTLLGDSGTGKSTTAVQQIQKGVKIFSDEITLISPFGIVHSWPIPIQLSEKSISELNVDRKSAVPFKKRMYSMKYQISLTKENLAKPAPLSFIRTPHSLFGALWRITLGTGLPQVLEYQLRLDNFPSIIKILTRRFLFATKLALTKKLICSVAHEI